MSEQAWAQHPRLTEAEGRTWQVLLPGRFACTDPAPARPLFASEATPLSTPHLLVGTIGAGTLRCAGKRSSLGCKACPSREPPEWTFRSDAPRLRGRQVAMLAKELTQTPAPVLLLEREAELAALEAVLGAAQSRRRSSRRCRGQCGNREDAVTGRGPTAGSGRGLRGTDCARRRTRGRVRVRDRPTTFRVSAGCSVRGRAFRPFRRRRRAEFLVVRFGAGDVVEQRRRVAVRDAARPVLAGSQLRRPPADAPGRRRSALGRRAVPSLARLPRSQARGAAATAAAGHTTSGAGEHTSHSRPHSWQIRPRS